MFRLPDFSVVVWLRKTEEFTTLRLSVSCVAHLGNYLLCLRREIQFIRDTPWPISLSLPCHSSRGAAINSDSFASFGPGGLASVNKAG
jgi:hypothetical protein